MIILKQDVKQKKERTLSKKELREKFIFEFSSEIRFALILRVGEVYIFGIKEIMYLVIYHYLLLNIIY
jgi:hypothetical protein